MLNAPPVNLAEKKISTLQHLEILNTVNFTVKLGDEDSFWFEHSSTFDSPTHSFELRF